MPPPTPQPGAAPPTPTPVPVPAPRPSPYEYQPDTDPLLVEPGAGTSGAATGDTSAQTDPFKGITGTTKRGLTIPGNVWELIEEAAGDPSDPDYVPADILAAVIYQADPSWQGLPPETIADVAAQLRDAYNQAIRYTSRAEDAAVRGQRGTGSRDEWLTAATIYRFGDLTAAQTPIGAAYRRDVSGYTSRAPEFGNDKAEPTGRYHSHTFPGVPSRVVYPPGAAGPAPVNIDDAYSLIESYLGREPRSEAEARGLVGLSIAAAQARLRSSTEGQWWREHGPAVKKARTWLDNMAIDYLGKPFDNQQVAEIVAQGWTPQTYEEHLRAQPYGASTIGQFYQTRRDAEAAAQKWLGKDTDPGVVNWLISHKFTSPDQIDAFYEQMKQRIDTGDAGFAWAADPETWRNTRTQVESAWRAAGLTGKVDPHLVNRAVDGKWTAADMQREIEALPAPGFAEGTTVGHVNATRKIAQGWQDQYDPGSTLSNAEISRFLGMSPAEIQQHYYALPAHASGEQPTTAPPPAEAKPIESAPGIRALAGGSVEQQARRQTERSAA